MRPSRPLAATLLVASAALLTACLPDASPAEVVSSPAPEVPTTSTESPSAAPPSEATAPATVTSDPIPAEATVGGALTVNPPPAPLVTAWARHQLYELSFVVPASPSDELSFLDDPDAYSVYRWNDGDTFDPYPLVHMSVASSATDGRATAPTGGHGEESVAELWLPGAEDAWVVTELPAEDPSMPGSYRSYFVIINTAARTYSVYIGVPRTDEGADAAEAAIAGLHLTTG